MICLGHGIFVLSYLNFEIFWEPGIWLLILPIALIIKIFLVFQSDVLRGSHFKAPAKILLCLRFTLKLLSLDELVVFKRSLLLGSIWANFLTNITSLRILHSELEILKRINLVDLLLVYQTPPIDVLVMLTDHSMI